MSSDVFWQSKNQAVFEYFLAASFMSSLTIVFLPAWFAKVIASFDICDAMLSRAIAYCLAPDFDTRFAPASLNMRSMGESGISLLFSVSGIVMTSIVVGIVSIYTRDVR